MMINVSPKLFSIHWSCSFSENSAMDFAAKQCQDIKIG